MNYKIRWNTTPQTQNQAEHDTTNTQTATDYSSATAILLEIFWTERDFCIISDCMNSFNNKLKKTHEQAKNFFNPANTQLSSEAPFSVCNM